MSVKLRRRRAASGPSPTLLLRRLTRWVALLVLLALPLQASGALHVITDAVVGLAGHALHEGAPACPYEEDGERCPPDCANCHCVLSVPALLPAMPSVALRRGSFTPPSGCSSPASLSPRLAACGLERPPRYLPSFA